MPVKIKADLKAVKKVTDEVKKNFRREISSGEIGKKLVITIQSFIVKGISPVEGAGRFKRYSDSYRKAIKRKWIKKQKVSPVDMFLTGDMLESLSTEEKGDKVFIKFEDKKAFWHNFGKGRLPVRKLLPQNGESFSKRITQLIIMALKKAAKK